MGMNLNTRKTALWDKTHNWSFIYKIQILHLLILNSTKKQYWKK
jgi:hypothetical protein